MQNRRGDARLRSYSKGVYEVPPTAWYLHYLLEQPWPVVIVLLAVAAVLRVVGRRGGDVRLVRGSFVAALLGVAVLATAYLLQTDREQVVQRSLQLVEAAERGDTTQLQHLLATRVTLLGPGGDPWLTGDAVHQRIEAGAHYAGGGDHRVYDTRAGVAGDVGVSVIRVRSRWERQGPGLARTAWRLEWERRDGRWQLTRLYWLDLEGREPALGYLMRGG